MKSAANVVGPARVLRATKVEPEPESDAFRSLHDLTYFRGRVALCAILKALGIGAGDHVAIQAYTCAAVPEAVLASGAKPVYVDIEARRFAMDPSDLERKLTAQTRAIVVQHTFGIPGPAVRLAQIARERGIHLIEDCCHTYLSEVAGRRVGSFGVASFYSFEWGKPVVAGMGGGVMTENPALRARLLQDSHELGIPPLARRLRLELEYLAYGFMFWPRLYWIARRLRIVLSSIGIAESDCHPQDYGDGGNPEYAYRMTVSSRGRLPREIGRIQQAADHSDWVTKQYRDRIHSPFVAHPASDPGSKTVFSRYPLITRHKDEIMRRSRRAMVAAAGWYSTPIHPLCSRDWACAGYVAGSCPEAERRSMETVALPVHLRVSQGDIDRAADFFNSLKL